MNEKTKKLWQIAALLLTNTALLVILASNAKSICLGCGGERVAEIQHALQNFGFFADEINGEYDFSTRRAVKNFQKAFGLEPSGEVNRKTAAALGMNSQSDNFSIQTELLSRFIQKHGGNGYRQMLLFGIDTLEKKGNMTLSRYIAAYDAEFFGSVASSEPSDEAYSAAAAAFKFKKE